MSEFDVLILAIVQGFAELLPVSSSAHVIVAEKLLGLDPSAPTMTLLLVMLHTGTMCAVIVYFWSRWRRTYFLNKTTFREAAIQIVIATVMTGIVGQCLFWLVQRTLLSGYPKAEIEDLFGHLELIAPALAAVGILILVAGIRERYFLGRRHAQHELQTLQAMTIGAVQGLCLPFRGFSRSGATISTAMLAGVLKSRSEDFSFALAVVLTPPAVAREILRLTRTEHLPGSVSLMSAAGSSILGAVLAFASGLLALRWLSAWLEAGRWYLFGVYCIVAAGLVWALHASGY